MSHAACGSAPREDVTAAPAVEVSTVEVERALLGQAFEAGGLVQAGLTATVASRLMADVRAVHVVAGDAVRRGQPLVTLDDRDLAAARARAAAHVEATTQGRAAVEAGRVAAEAELTLAQLTHDRIAGLHERRAATTQELDQAGAVLAAARARLATLDAQLTEAAAGIAAAEAARDGAAVALSHATLRAPFDGVVSDTMVDPGNQVAPGTPLVRVESRARRVDVSVDAGRAAGLETGQPADVWLDDRQRPVAGVIAEIARTVESGLQSVTLKVSLPESVDVPSGRFARVRIAGSPREALAVPASAVVRRGQLTSVFIAGDDQRARLRLVSLGDTAGGHTELVAGVEAGERVIVDPPAHLTDGARLTLRGGRR
jgi:multidrug efflux pump subunit AcrA (membrane-fusion protein)